MTKYEIYAGATPNQLTFWNTIFEALTVISPDELAVDTAVTVNNALKKKRKQIDLADLFIAATAVANDLPLATLNRKHFDRVNNLEVLE